MSVALDLAALALFVLAAFGAWITRVATVELVAFGLAALALGHALE